MPYPFFLIDAFVTPEPGSGNPAGVVILESEPVWPTDAWMQEIAAEVNQAETAFLLKEGQDYGLRWFTPKVEVDLCGHATIAATAALNWSTPVTYHTRSGPLHCQIQGEFVSLDFPVKLIEHGSPPQIPDGLKEAIFWGNNKMDWLAQMETADQVRFYRPDFDQIESLGMRGLIVTAPSDVPHYDFISRFFAPSAGVPEDHVTGSAHCALAPYWAQKLGKTTLTSLQASPRTGIIHMKIQGDRVHLSGKCHIRASGLWQS